MSQSLTERYGDRIAGMLSCYDRVVITGTVPVICYAEGMTRFLCANGIRIFDYPQFARTLRDHVRDGAASLAAAGTSNTSPRVTFARKVVARTVVPGRKRRRHPARTHGSASDSERLPRTRRHRPDGCLAYGVTALSSLCLSMTDDITLSMLLRGRLINRRVPRKISVVGRHRGVSVRQSDQRGTYLRRRFDIGQGPEVRHDLQKLSFCNK
jgi:hypothetical protein